jgi:hypothetical protein
VIGMALGVTGKYQMRSPNCDTTTRITANLADRRMESGREWRPALSLLTSYTARTRRKKTIISCWDTVAELEWEAEEKRKAPSCAVPFLFVLVLPVKSLAIIRQSCAAMSAPGEIKEQVYKAVVLLRDGPRNQQLYLSWALLRT